MKKEEQRGAKPDNDRQIWGGPVWVRRDGANVLLAVAYRIDNQGTATEYWAILAGQKLDPGSTPWTPLDLCNPNDQPAGAPTPTAAQFIKWARHCMYVSHGVHPDLDYFQHAVTTLT